MSDRKLRRRPYTGVSIIGSEVSAGQQFYGTEEAPRAILSRLEQQPEWMSPAQGNNPQWRQLPVWMELVKETVLTLAAEDTPPQGDPQSILARTLRQTADKVEQALRHGNTVLSLGGDHSIAIGSIEGSRRVYGSNLLVLWIDAHGDFNTPDRSATGNIHGMPLAALCGEFSFTGSDWKWLSGALKGHQVVHAAGRAFDGGECERMRQMGIEVIESQRLTSRPLAKLADSILQALSRDPAKRLWVTFDLDAISSEFTPGTGTPEPEGLDPNECRELIRKLAGSQQCIGVEIVELNPKLDSRDQLTTTIAADLAMEALDGFQSAAESSSGIPTGLETAS
jgi:arginase